MTSGSVSSSLAILEMLIPCALSDFACFTRLRRSHKRRGRPRTELPRRHGGLATSRRSNTAAIPTHTPRLRPRIVVRSRARRIRYRTGGGGHVRGGRHASTRNRDPRRRAHTAFNGRLGHETVCGNPGGRNTRRSVGHRISEPASTGRGRARKGSSRAAVDGEVPRRVPSSRGRIPQACSRPVHSRAAGLHPGPLSGGRSEEPGSAVHDGCALRRVRRQDRLVQGRDLDGRHGLRGSPYGRFGRSG